MSSVKGQKFLELEIFFKSCEDDYIELTFEQIEAIIGQKLSVSAYKYPAYWYPSETHTITLSWINVGYEMNKLDLKGRKVTYTKVKIE